MEIFDIHNISLHEHTQVCPDWDGVCDAEQNPTTCNYCSDDHLCTPGLAQIEKYLKLLLQYQDVLTTPTASLATSATATNADLLQLALTMHSATRGFPTSATLKTHLTPPASTVRAGNANQVDYNLLLPNQDKQAKII